jgi:hypothetical protein
MVYRVYMTLKTSLIIAAIIVTLLTSNLDAATTSLNRQIQELPINPNFAPDYNCLFDVFQIKAKNKNVQKVLELMKMQPVFL